MLISSSLNGILAGKQTPSMPVRRRPQSGRSAQNFCLATQLHAKKNPRKDVVLIMQFVVHVLKTSLTFSNYTFGTFWRVYLRHVLFIFVWVHSILLLFCSCSRM